MTRPPDTGAATPAGDTPTLIFTLQSSVDGGAWHVAWHVVASTAALGLGVAAALNAPIPETRFGVFRM